MDEFHPIIYLFNPTQIKFIHIKSFIYEHIHSCKWIKITSSFKLGAQSSKLRLYVHAQAIPNTLVSPQIPM